MKRSKKIALLIITLIISTSLVACSNNEEKSEAVDVPQNNQEKGNNNEKEKGNEANDVENEIKNPDLSGAIAETTSTGIIIYEANDEGTNDQGESIVASNKDGEKTTVEFTEKTEFKKLIIKNKKDGRLEKGSRADVIADTGVLLYGSYAGSKFVATKAIITIIE